MMDQGCYILFGYIPACLFCYSNYSKKDVKHCQIDIYFYFSNALMIQLVKMCSDEQFLFFSRELAASEMMALRELLHS